MAPSTAALILLATLATDGPTDRRAVRLVTLDGEHPVAFPSAAEAWPAWRDRLRTRVRVALGLRPEWPRTALNDHIYGRIARDGYTVEKVVFESVPGLLVTGNLYRPTAEAIPSRGRPAVLCPHGHWQDGRLNRADDAAVERLLQSGAERHPTNARFHLQARCAHLARMGCVVFHYDMLGYADSRQLGHGEGFRDAQSQLWGQSAMALQTWNSIRAVDLVASLPEVDPARIAATGASGGGTQTFMLAALDERLSAAVPAVMASTRMQGGCVCENASHLRVGTSNIELCGLIAPRPLYLIGANDWTVAIEERGLPELRTLYAMLGQGDHVDGRCLPEFDHNYNLVSRTLMYRFLADHLGLPSDESSITERPLDPIEPDDLRVFDAEHPRPDGAANAAAIRTWLTDVARQQQRSWLPRDSASLATFRSIVGDALAVVLDREHLPPDDPRLDPERAWRSGSTSVVSGRLVHGSDETWSPARLAVPDRWSGACVVLVSDRSGEPMLPDHGAPTAEASALIDRGAAVLAIDVFTPDGGTPREAYRHDRYAGYTYGYNPTLLAYRAQDIIAALTHARSLAGVTSVRLAGLGRAGAWALLAAAADSVAPDRVVARWRDPFSDLDDVNDDDFLPGALRYGGLPCFTALLAPTPLRLMSTDEIPDAVLAAYRAAGHVERVSRSDDLDDTTLDFLAANDTLATGRPDLSPPAPLGDDVVVRVAHLRVDGAPGLLELRRDFERRNPGYAIRHHPRLRDVRADGATVVLFLQDGEGRTPEVDVPLRRGDVVVLRDGESLSVTGEPSAVEFRVPATPPPAVPRFVRPDFDPAITDTPGGCAEEEDAYRRILLTWHGKNGPYLFHALNAHRVRIRDSFSHYHPVDGGFDELYLVQGVTESARLLTSRHTDRITRPASVTADEVAGLIVEHRLEPGDLVYLPRGVIHRGIGGVLTQVITVPGFLPGAEIGVDHHLRSIDERLRSEGRASLPFHAQGSVGPVIK